MEHNVVSLETAKKLKQAGFSQYTIFYHLVDKSMSYSIKICQDKDTGILRGTQHIISAPTAQEIADQLPFKVGDCYLEMRISYDNRKWGAQYRGHEKLYSGFYDNMVEALGDLWLKLHKA